jgi:hypothetical protein
MDIMGEFLESSCSKQGSCISIFSLLLASMEQLFKDGGGDSKNRAYCVSANIFPVVMEDTNIYKSITQY